MKKTSILFFLLTLFLFACSRSSESHFKNLIGYSPTADVKNLNSYTDEIGIDASYWLAFECSDSTVDKIVAKLQLTKSEIETDGLSGGLNSKPKPWWDTKFIRNSKPYYREENRILWYLWHDVKAKKVYFLTFDL